uniref:Beta-mannosidase B n=1 Tax=Timema bartmani TaxID=61472 RepID=A0A7R9I1X2_9NEOP|nr:unnamed protein product [Timema bartmani]
MLDSRVCTGLPVTRKSLDPAEPGDVVGSQHWGRRTGNLTFEGRRGLKRFGNPWANPSCLIRSVGLGRDCSKQETVKPHVEPSSGRAPFQFVWAEPDHGFESEVLLRPATSSAMWFLLLHLGLTATLTRAELLLSLNGPYWTVAGSNGTVSVPATVPGGIYTDLRTAGVLDGDPFYRFNDVLYRWVARDNWTYARTFAINADTFLTKRQVTLVFHGLDTVAEVFVNNVSVGVTNNMFTRYAFPVKRLLRAGDNNSVEVRFLSPITAAEQAYRVQSAAGHTVPPRCVPVEYNGECHVNHLRKMQASFGWDWGPAFPSVGIWKSVEIIAYDAVVVRDVTIRYDWGNSTLTLGVHLELGNGSSGAIRGKLEAVLGSNPQVGVSRQVIVESGKEGEYLGVLVLPVPANIELWWPIGLGEQYLYNLTIRFVGADVDERSVKKIRYGFRKVSLIQDKLTPKGLTFYLKVNGVAMFAKGSNWIPAHILPELSVDERTYKNLLTAARDANMNMLRVWGGGVYEDDSFYQLCDELGLIIWQDAMFACSMYPASEGFLASVEREVRQQVRRLQHHASVVVWAGNNENEAALRQNWYETAANFSLYRRDYVSLYVDTVRAAFTKEDPSGMFVTSSPSNGDGTEKEGFVASNPQSPFYGDTHYYNYLADGWNANVYSMSRFASEYGFQSLPSFSTLHSVMNTKWDLGTTSNWSIHRQHHLGGYMEMKMQISRHMHYPEDDSTSSGFQRLCYLSQVNQAMATKVETEHYRRSRGVLDSLGQGMTMGALYWQLNDVWQAPSWSSLEFGGRWKLLHYFAARFFAPLSVSAYLTPDDRVEVHIVSDRLETFEVTLVVHVYNWGELGIPKDEVMLNVSIDALSSQQVLSLNLDELLTKCSNEVNARHHCFLHFYLLHGSQDAGPDNFIFLAPLKDSALRHASVRVVERHGPFRRKGGVGSYYSLEVATDAIAPFVWLEDVDPPRSLLR